MRSPPLTVVGGAVELRPEVMKVRETSFVNPLVNETDETGNGRNLEMANPSAVGGKGERGRNGTSDLSTDPSRVYPNPAHGTVACPVEPASTVRAMLWWHNTNRMCTVMNAGVRGPDQHSHCRSRARREYSAGAGMEARRGRQPPE